MSAAPGMSAGVRWECMRLAAVEVKTSDLVRLRVVGIVPCNILGKQNAKSKNCVSVPSAQLIFRSFLIFRLLDYGEILSAGD